MENNVEKIDLDHVDWRSSREFFESLGETLDRLDDKDESYNFTWVGKRKCIIEAGAPINKTLRPDIEASKNFDDTKNILITGDNLDALKLLQESYLGKIKMIYIDPPYNTGHDFVYHDNFAIKKEDYADSSAKGDGIKTIAEDPLRENSRSNGRFHSDWLSMMYPRLKLARNLLSDDGVIFISIDDNEQSTLKIVCDEIFGEDNFIGNITRLTKKSSNNGTQFSPCTDYILCYARALEFVPQYSVPLTDEQIATYNKEDEKGKYKEIGLYMAALKHGGSRYPIEAPDGTKLITPGEAPWRWNQQTFNDGLKNGLITFKQTNSSPLINFETGERSNWNIYTKLYLSSREDAGLHPRTLLDDFQNTSASGELRKLGIPFDFAKPSELIAYLAKLQTKNDDIILDFFAGSGSTGHGIMQLNANDGGNRSYILVQLDEKTGEKSDAKKAGFNTIDQITAERLRRAGDKISGEADATKLDVGFRVFHIDDSNERNDIRKPLGEAHQSNIFDMVNNIKEDRSPLDLLFGIIYASALPFDLNLEKRTINNNTVYLYGYLDAGTGLSACFDDDIPEETIKEIANLKALTAAFKDSSFADSAAKINLSEHFRIISPDTKVKVL